MMNSNNLKIESTYIMIDHGGVLDGEYTYNPSKNDLILKEEEEFIQILKNDF